MRLTTFTDYSLRVFLYCASHSQRRVTIREIALAFAISENHLMKVVHFLSREGLLSSTRGRGGGLSLAAPAESLNLGELVRLTEGAPKLAECFDRATNQCVITPGCKLRTAFEEAARAFYEVLGRYTLEDITRNRQVLARMLVLPRRGSSRRVAGHSL
jgi:Rrf2 family nitric oxide-sensitive transcriptional repressor